MRVRYAAAARRDLSEVVDYIAAANPRAADATERAILAVAKRLGDFPSFGPVGRWPGTREAVVPNLPYVLIYEVDGQAVTIVAVLHGARDVARALESRTPEEDR
jgi:toxin ParE1/3/4